MSPRQSIERLGPYPSLLRLGLPTATVEPLKLSAVALPGKGHWIAGTVVIAACYAFSRLVVELPFDIVKPKLLEISWFAKLWNGFVAVRTGAWKALRRFVGVRPGQRSSPPSPEFGRHPEAWMLSDRRSLRP